MQEKWAIQQRAPFLTAVLSTAGGHAIFGTTPGNHVVAFALPKREE